MSKFFQALSVPSKYSNLMFFLHQIDGQGRRWLCDKDGKTSSASRMQNLFTNLKTKLVSSQKPTVIIGNIVNIVNIATVATLSILSTLSVFSTLSTLALFLKSRNIWVPRFFLRFRIFFRSMNFWDLRALLNSFNNVKIDNSIQIAKSGKHVNDWKW